MMYRTLVIPEHELAVLRELLQAPEHHALLQQIPGLAAAVQHPLPDIKPVLKAAVSAHALQAELQSCRHGQGLAPAPDESALQAARAMYTALNAHRAQLEEVSPAPEIVEGACPCCGSTRFATSQSSGDAHWFAIPHLGFKVDYGYTPAGFGVPTGGDGPNFKVCLDCGRIRGRGEPGNYPLTDAELEARIARYREETGSDGEDA